MCLLREPYWRDSAKLLAMAETRQIDAWICPTTITTLHYLGCKVLGEKTTRGLLESLLSITQVGVLDSAVFASALASEVADFEDAVIESVAAANVIDHIATRNVKDFRKSRVEAKEPSRF